MSPDIRIAGAIYDSRKPPPQGIYAPSFYRGKAGKYIACRLIQPLLILEYIIHVGGVYAPCFIHSFCKLIDVVTGAEHNGS